MLQEQRSPKRFSSANKDVEIKAPPRRPRAQQVFPVAIVENEQAVRCGLAGIYQLYINNNDLSLHSITKNEVLYTWPYSYIRRYGRTSKNFQFEAGRKCRSGAGLFSLITEEGLGDQIFSHVSKRFEEIRHTLQSLTPPSSQDDDSSDDEGFSPELPPRNYKQDTLRSLFGFPREETKSQSDQAMPNHSPSPMRSKKSKPKPIPRAQYEEIDIPEECVSPTKSKSPSFFNSLIQKNKSKLRHTTSSVSSSSSSSAFSEDGLTESNLYHVLCDDYVQQHPSELNYSQVTTHTNK